MTVRYRKMTHHYSAREFGRHQEPAVVIGIERPEVCEDGPHAFWAPVSWIIMFCAGILFWYWIGSFL